MRLCILKRTRHTPRQGVLKMFRIALMLLAVGCLAHEARAQALNMDMSSLIGRQVALEAQAYQSAQAAAQAWYAWVQKRRVETGDYTTPSYSGFNAGTISQSVKETNGVYEASNSAWHAQQQALSNVLGKYVEHGIMGQQTLVDPATGQQYTVGNAYQYYHVNPQGGVQGTTSYQPPNNYFDWRLLLPVR